MEWEKTTVRKYPAFPFLLCPLFTDKAGSNAFLFPAWNSHFRQDAAEIPVLGYFFDVLFQEEKPFYSSAKSFCFRSIISSIFSI